jgi:tetratricopeptide (TPR) repeat protein
VWWNEAAGASSDRPLRGWGAGSFPVVHLLYRRDALSVRQPHSVPLQFLAETGIVGAFLGVGAYALLIVAGVGTARRREGNERLLAAALVAGAVAYAVHALYDWDWDIPGVTLPVLLFLGALAGSRGRLDEDEPPSTWGPAPRAVGLVAATLTLCTFAVSALLPRLAGTKASSALVAASSTSQARLQAALSTAEEAARLDPLSDEGLKAAAAISANRGQPVVAESYLRRAIERDPNDVGAWEQLSNVQLQLRDQRGLGRTANRLLALDPKGTFSLNAAKGIHTYQLAGTPPVTASQTPLPGP